MVKEEEEVMLYLIFSKPTCFFFWNRPVGHTNQTERGGESV
jgi:hypothetical protein